MLPQEDRFWSWACSGTSSYLPFDFGCFLAPHQNGNLSILLRKLCHHFRVFLYTLLSSSGILPTSGSFAAWISDVSQVPFSWCSRLSEGTIGRGHLAWFCWRTWRWCLEVAPGFALIDLGTGPRSWRWCLTSSWTIFDNLQNMRTLVSREWLVLHKLYPLHSFYHYLDLVLSLDYQSQGWIPQQHPIW